MAKVLVVGSYAESLINFRGKLLEAMVARGHEVLACAPDISEIVGQQLSELGVAFREVHLQRTGLNPANDLRFMADLCRTISAFSPDCFLGYTVKPVVYGSIAASLCRVPAIYNIVTGMGNAVTGGTGRYRVINQIVKRLYRFSLKKNERVFFQNPDDIAYFQTAGYLRCREQAVLINGSGIDLEAFIPTAFPENFSFLLIARLIADKGIREYAAAAKILKQKYPHLLFRLAGPLDTNPSALKMSEITRWVDDGIIEYSGRLDDVRPAITDTSVYVLPSYYREGTPRTILEALAMGRPVITTDAPGCRETVMDGKNGILIPVKDVPALVEAMEYFVSQPEKVAAYGRESRKLAEKKYDVNLVNAKILTAMGLYDGQDGRLTSGDVVSS